jgi:hypothetical protein
MGTQRPSNCLHWIPSVDLPSQNWSPPGGIAGCHMGHLRGGYLAKHHSQRGPVISKGLPPNISLQMLAKGQQPTGSITAHRENDGASVVGNHRSGYLNLVAGQPYHSGTSQASEATRTQVEPRNVVSAVAHMRLGPRGDPRSQKDARGEHQSQSIPRYGRGTGKTVGYAHFGARPY